MTEPAKPEGTAPEAPDVESVKIMAYIFAPAVRPVIYTLAAVGAIIGASLWLDGRAHEYIEHAADAAMSSRLQTASSNITALQMQATDHEARLRTMESMVAHVDASVTELLRRDDARHEK